MSIDENGFHRETLDEIIVGLTTKAKNTIGNISLDPSNLLYQWLKVVASRKVQLQTLAELLVSNMTPQGASGVFVDYHLLMSGLQRKEAEYAVGNLELTNGSSISNQEVPIGISFSTSDGIEYVSVSNGIFVENLRLIHTASARDVIEQKYYQITPNADYGPLAKGTVASATSSTVVINEPLTNLKTPKTFYSVDTSTYVVTPYTYGTYDLTSKTFTSVTPDCSGVTGNIYVDQTDAKDAYWINGITNSSGVDRDAIYYLNNTNNLVIYDDDDLITGQSYLMKMVTPMTVSVSIKSTESGADGNTSRNTVTINTNSYGISYITGITNNVGITNGQNMEDDSTAKRRLLEAKNRHFTLENIKDMINNLQGVRDCKVSQVVSSDLVYPNVWADADEAAGNDFDMDDYKCIRIPFSPDIAVTMKGITLRANYIGTPGDLYAQLVRTDKLYGTDDSRILATASASIGDMRNGPFWQDLLIPLKYSGLEINYTYYINIYVKDTNTLTGSSDQWYIATDPDTTGATITYQGTKMGTCNLAAAAITGQDYMFYEYTGAITALQLADVDKMLIGNEDDKPCNFVTDYNLIVMDDEHDVASGTAYVSGTKILTTDTNLTAKFSVGTVAVVIFDDTDTFYLATTATLADVSTTDTLEFATDIDIPATPTGYHFVVYDVASSVNDLDNNYVSGTVVTFYDNIATTGHGDLAVKTMYGIPAIVASIVSEEGYDYESELREDIENMLDWDGGEGYCPLGIEYTTQEAIPLEMDVEFYVAYDDGYTISIIDSLVEEKLTTYLASLNPGDDIIYSQMYKQIMLTAGVYRIKGLTVTIGSFVTSDDNEIDILIDEGEYVQLNSVSLKQI